MYNIGMPNIKIQKNLNSEGRIRRLLWEQHESEDPARSALC